MAMRLLQATREQLQDKPTREVEPAEIAQQAGINPYSREYDTALRYLLDHGYIEHYPNEAVTALGLYRAVCSVVDPYRINGAEHLPKQPRKRS
jgi:hypothetical protein